MRKYFPLTLMYSERPKLYTILAFLSAIGLRVHSSSKKFCSQRCKEEFIQVNITIFSEKRQESTYKSRGAYWEYGLVAGQLLIMIHMICRPETVYSEG